MKTLIASGLYLLTAIACFVAAAGSRAPAHPRMRRERHAWIGVCVAIALFGLLRPFEVHSLITDALRRSAMTSGWYDERATEQMALLLVLGFLLAVAAGFFLFETRRWHLSTRVGVAAAIYLFALLVLNILSLHGLDRLLGRAVAGIPIRWLFDLAGLASAVGAAFWFQRAAAPPARKRL